MSRSNWGIIAAAIGVLGFAGVVALALYPEQPNLTGNTGYEKRAAGYRAGGADCQPSEVDRLAGEKGARRAVTCKEAEEQHRLQTNNLIQQRRAADAADASAIFAFQQTRIGAIGAALGLITMCAAIAAAWYARDAAKQGKRGADISKDTYGAFIALERPRIVISVANVGTVTIGDVVRHIVTIKAANIGKSACVITMLAIDWLATNIWDSDGVCIGTAKSTFVAATSEQTLENVEASDLEAQPYLTGFAKYTSPIGEHTSYFCIRVVPDDPKRMYDPKHRDARGPDWPTDT